MRHLYTALFTLAIPVILLRLVWRGYKAPAYLQRWRERFGYYHNESDKNVIWFHTVSVGETEAAVPLVRFFLKHNSDRRILITTTTPTGSARVTEVFGDTVEHVYLPYDLPTIVNRFLAHFKPVIAIIMETEIWPNLYQGCAQNKIPLNIVNARLSSKSVAGYRLLPSLIKQTLANVHIIAAQTEDDRARFITLGADISKVQTTGNIKFDLEIPREIFQRSRKLRQMTFHRRLVWIIASSHKGEEEIFLDLYKQLKEKFPELLLVLVPRHPERFSEVKNLCNKHRLRTILRTANMPCHDAVDVYLGDTMGELKLLYAASDIAFVGGSMVPVGGHNILEPAAVGVPVMFGPYMDNFKDIARGLLDKGAAIQCQDREEIINAFSQLVEDSEQRQRLINQGREFVLQNQGALGRVGALLSRVLSIKTNNPISRSS